MTVSRRLRFEILRRDNYTCRYCGASPTNSSAVVLEVDHVIPVTLGGNDDPRNLVTACADCNAGKASMPADAPIVEDVDATAMLFAKAVERAAEIQRAKVGDVDALLGEFLDEWKYETMLPANWASTVESYLRQGLTIDELKRNVYIAMTSQASANNVFRYFCGVCRNVITERHELARRLIEDGDV